jgi:hypothetical protein
MGDPRDNALIGYLKRSLAAIVRAARAESFR